MFIDKKFQCFDPDEFFVTRKKKITNTLCLALIEKKTSLIKYVKSNLSIFDTIAKVFCVSIIRKIFIYIEYFFPT